VRDNVFVAICYVLTLGSLLSYATVLLRRARRAGRVAKSEELPWT